MIGCSAGSGFAESNEIMPVKVLIPGYGRYRHVSTPVGMVGTIGLTYLTIALSGTIDYFVFSGGILWRPAVDSLIAAYGSRRF